MNTELDGVLQPADVPIPLGTQSQEIRRTTTTTTETSEDVNKFEDQEAASAARVKTEFEQLKMGDDTPSKALSSKSVGTVTETWEKDGLADVATAVENQVGKESLAKAAQRDEPAPLSSQNEKMVQTKIGGALFERVCDIAITVDQTFKESRKRIRKFRKRLQASRRKLKSKEEEIKTLKEQVESQGNLNAILQTRFHEATREAVAKIKCLADEAVQAMEYTPMAAMDKLVGIIDNDPSQEIVTITNDKGRLLRSQATASNEDEIDTESYSDEESFESNYGSEKTGGADDDGDIEYIPESPESPKGFRFRLVKEPEVAKVYPCERCGKPLASRASRSRHRKAKKACDDFRNRVRFSDKGTAAK